jgi:hypothetical protein
MRARLLEWLGEKESGGPVVFDEQRLKVLLARNLLDSGVRLLTHSFLSEPILDGPALLGFAIQGKTGVKPLVAAKIVDASERLDTTALLGCPRTAKRREVSLGMKANGLDFGALSAARGWSFDSAGRLVAAMDFPLRWSMSGLHVRADRVLLICDRERNQAIVHGVRAEAAGADQAFLSELQAALRRACYFLLHELRLRAPGFAASHIVAVATRMDLYGLVGSEAGSYRNLVLCNAAAERGDNDAAVGRGVDAAAAS